MGAMGFAVSIPFISIYFHAELGLSMSEIGIFFGVMALVRSVFQMIGGELSDRIERRYLLVHSQFYRAIAFGLLALSIYFDWGFWMIAIGMAINSVFGAVFHPTANALVSDILPAEKRLDGYAITRSMGTLGWAAGPAVGGFLAHYSYSLLFFLSAIVTFLSGAVFLWFLKSPAYTRNTERFKFRDLLSIKDDPNLAKHSLLIFLLYLVVAQLIAPFSVYAVEMAGISEGQLGMLYMVNGLLVVLLQLPTTNLLRNMKLTYQLALGGLIYAIGYGMVGIYSGFTYFLVAIIIVTLGEICMSPPSLALTSRMAPEGRMGRYMGIFSFFVASGWSFGPLYGGFILDYASSSPILAWTLISSLAMFSAIGYFIFSKSLPDRLNNRDGSDVT